MTELYPNLRCVIKGLHCISQKKHKKIHHGKGYLICIYILIEAK